MIKFILPVLIHKQESNFLCFITGLYSMYHRVLCKVRIARVVGQFRHSTENEAGMYQKKEWQFNFNTGDLL